MPNDSWELFAEEWVMEDVSKFLQDHRCCSLNFWLSHLGQYHFSIWIKKTKFIFYYSTSFKIFVNLPKFSVHRKRHYDLKFQMESKEFLVGWLDMLVMGRALHRLWQSRCRLLVSSIIWHIRRRWQIHSSLARSEISVEYFSILFKEKFVMVDFRVFIWCMLK